MYGKVPDQPRIGFRDRPLNKGEKYHHYCVECGVEPTIDKKDFILIIEIRKNYQGWLPKEAWDWINERVSY